MSDTVVSNHPSSYRDPSGFIFEKEGVIYRQVNTVFKDHYTHFINSGLYQHFADNKMLVPHEEIKENLTGSSNFYITIKPEKIPFISYAYEWPFDMLKDAALLTLQLAKDALNYSMILKDATPYNIQWKNGQPIFIDTISFEKYEATPWIAYRQFCENFLGPLLIMHYSKQHLPQLYTAWPNGIPLSVIQSLLPKKSKWSLHTYLHIHLHNRIANKNKGGEQKGKPFDKQKLLNLFTSLELLIKKLHVPQQVSTWSDYYQEAAQRNHYLDSKKKIITEWLQELTPVQAIADLGANEGEFSALASSYCKEIIAADFDPYCINKLYLKKKSEPVYPLVIDLSNPSPALGVNNEERSSFLQRLQVDIIFAFALIHHLAIGKNIPFNKIAALFAQCCQYLIIEFVPKEDEKVQLMLKQKEDIYSAYTEKEFISSFEEKFTILKKENVQDSPRVLFLMKKK